MRARGPGVSAVEGAVCKRGGRGRGDTRTLSGDTDDNDDKDDDDDDDGEEEEEEECVAFIALSLLERILLRGGETRVTSGDTCERLSAGSEMVRPIPQVVRVREDGAEGGNAPREERSAAMPLEKTGDELFWLTGVEMREESGGAVQIRGDKEQTMAETLSVEPAHSAASISAHAARPAAVVATVLLSGWE